MKKQSAGLLAFRNRKKAEVLLVHPGGPFYKAKDLGVWSIPKGEYTDENPLQVAIREFTEETGNIIDSDEYIGLGDTQLTSGKIIKAWAVPSNFETSYISSNLFELEWPPKSGKTKLFPEVDKAGWFTLEQARLKLNPAQVNFLDQLVTILKNRS